MIVKLFSRMRAILLLAGVVFASELLVAADPAVTVSAQQRYPWNGLVDVAFTITGESGTKYDTSFVARDVAGGTNLTMKTVYKSDGSVAALTNQLAAGSYKWVWNAAADLPDEFNCERVVVDVNANVHLSLYMVIDLSAGSSASSYPVSYLDAVPSGGWTDAYKTTKLVMRRCNAGSFVMGSPAGEQGRYDEDEVQHKVTLSRDFYIGVFELSQKQYTLVTGKNPCSSSSYGKGGTYPVYYVSYNDIRGSNYGSKWPGNSSVDGSSFMGLLRRKTAIETIDLPTEAQWEYACRAGSTGMYAGTGKITSMGWYGDNAGGKAHPIGVKTSNGWGLYDMHGNVQEWTRDWFSQPSNVAVIDPAPNDGESEGCRVRRGGSWYDDADECRSADRNHNSIADAWNSFPDHTSNALGFRVGLTCD